MGGTENHFWKEHWTERSSLPSELAVGGRPSNRPSEFLHMVAGIARGLKVDRQDVVLDAGCANGLIALALAPWVREIWACDLIPSMLSQARSMQNGTRNVHLFAADVRQLPLRHSMFTKILLVGVLQCLDGLDQVQRALLGLSQVIRRGGSLWAGWILDAEKRDSYFEGIDRLSADDSAKEQIRDRNRRALWLRKEEFTEAGQSAGFAVHIQKLSGSPWQTPYMFDAILTR